MRILLAALLSSLLLCVPMGALARGDVQDNVNLSGLSDATKAEILKSVAKAKEDESSGSVKSTLEKTAEWMPVAERIVNLVPLLAEKTAIGADRVLDSSTGRILLTIILVKMFWSKILGILFLTVGLFVWYKIFERIFSNAEITYAPHPNPVLRFLNISEKTIKRGSITAGIEEAPEILCIVAVVSLAFILAAGLVGLLN